MSNIRAKILQTFKHLKSDAVPRAPRDTCDQEPDPDVLEDIPQPTAESHRANQEKDPNKKTFFASDKKKKKKAFDAHKGKPQRESVINTQAAGNVINIVNSQDVHWGNEYTYYLGATNGSAHDQQSDDFDEPLVEKDNRIALLMESTGKPEHMHIDHISKNLGKNWRSVFRSLGYTKGRIETTEIDEAKNGVSEARYKLLLDWTRNDDDGTLGKLATLLWEEGEREIVRDLSLLCSKRKL